MSLNVALDYTAGLLQPSSNQAGFIAIVNDEGNNLRYVDPREGIPRQGEPTYQVPIVPKYNQSEIIADTETSTLTLEAIPTGEFHRISYQVLAKNDGNDSGLLMYEATSYVYNDESPTILATKIAADIEPLSGFGTVFDVAVSIDVNDAFVIDVTYTAGSNLFDAEVIIRAENLIENGFS